MFEKTRPYAEKMMEIVSSLTKKAPNLTLSLLDKKIFKKKQPYS